MQVQFDTRNIQKLSLKSRLDYLDNLKVALTMLVVAHHAGQPYGGSGGWWHVHDSENPVELGPFFGVNASFFMSLFFLISAYFMPASFDKKGSASFLKDRMKRLGIPLLFGFFILIPGLMYLYYLNFRGYGSIGLIDYYLNVYFGMGPKPMGWTGPSWPDLNFGHLWFIEHLLVYSILYIFIRKWLRVSIPSISLTLPRIFLFIFVLSFLTFVARIEYPIDRWIGLFGFIQMEIAHFPQYLSFFIFGVLAYRNQWLEQIKQMGKPFLWAGIFLAGLRYLGLITWAGGGLSMTALFYAFYETAMCTSLIIGLIFLFRERYTNTTTFLKSMSENSYAVYIIHIPVLVGLQYILLSWEISGYVKFVLASFFGILFSFLGAMWIRKLPFLRGIL